MFTLMYFFEFGQPFSSPPELASIPAGHDTFDRVYYEKNNKLHILTIALQTPGSNTGSLHPTVVITFILEK